MRNETQKICEFNIGKHIVKVNKALFDEHLNEFKSNFGRVEYVGIHNIYSKNGEYIGSYSRLFYSDEDDEYYLPKER